MEDDDILVIEETPYKGSPGYLIDTILENATESPEISPPKSTFKDLERAITEVTSKKIALEVQREKGSELDKREREFKIQEYEKKLLQYRVLVAKAKEEQKSGMFGGIARSLSGGVQKKTQQTNQSPRW